MNPIVVKFGGSSLATAAQFEKVAAIIREAPARRYVVASAPGKRFDGDTKVTDLLYAAYDAAVRRAEKFRTYVRTRGRTSDASFVPYDYTRGRLPYYRTYGTVTTVRTVRDRFPYRFRPYVTVRTGPVPSVPDPVTGPG